MLLLPPTFVHITRNDVSNLLYCDVIKKKKKTSTYTRVYCENYETVLAKKKKLYNNIRNIFADIEDVFHVPTNICICTFYTPALCGEVYNLIYIYT